jgi:hypothetical protein
VHAAVWEEKADSIYTVVERLERGTSSDGEGKHSRENAYLGGIEFRANTQRQIHHGE